MNPAEHDLLVSLSELLTRCVMRFRPGDHLWTDANGVVLVHGTLE